MKCYIHTDKDAVASCVRCGNLICEECRVFIDGKNVCKNCLANSSNQTDWVRNAGSAPFTGGGLNIDMKLVSKILLYVALAFSSIELLNRVVLFANNVLTSVLFMDYGISNIILQLCNIMLIGTFAIIVLVNLSKLTNISFINDGNIGAITAIAFALLVLECLIFAVFNVYTGFFSMLRANLSDMSVAIPLIATAVNIFGIYKHKLNINIKY